MAKAKSAKPKKLFSPLLLSIAAMTGWAATHEPADFSNPGMAGAWLLTAFAMGLATRAVLALAAPLVKLGLELSRITLGKAVAPNQAGTDS